MVSSFFARKDLQHRIRDLAMNPFLAIRGTTLSSPPMMSEKAASVGYTESTRDLESAIVRSRKESVMELFDRSMGLTIHA